MAFYTLEHELQCKEFRLDDAYREISELKKELEKTEKELEGTFTCEEEYLTALFESEQAEERLKELEQKLANLKITSLREGLRDREEIQSLNLQISRWVKLHEDRRLERDNARYEAETMRRVIQLALATQDLSILEKFDKLRFDWEE